MLAILMSVAITHAPVTVSDVKSASYGPLQTKATQQLLIAQKYGGADPHGDDPHGDDPHDENHDKGLPANKDRSQGKAPKDVYGDKYPNSQQPY